MSSRERGFQSRPEGTGRAVYTGLLEEPSTQVSWKSRPGRVPLAAKCERENMREGFRETSVAGAGWMRGGSEGAMVLWVTLRTSYGFYSEEV